MKNFIRLLLLGLLITSSYDRGHCAATVKNKGEYVKQGEIPYQVSVQAGGTHLCSGALIDERHVLSAARCFVWNGMDYNSNALGELTVVVGSTDLKTNSSRLSASVVEIIMPAGYDASYGNAHIKDLAVVKLQEPLNLKGNANISFVNLPVSIQTYASKYGIITGFQPLIEINENGEYIFHQPNLKLNKLEALIIHDHVCKSVYSKGTIQDNHLCAYAFAVKKQFYGACKIDDGAPLVYNNVVIGISSPGTNNCGKAPSIFTKVSAFVQLIEMARRGHYTNEMKVIHFEPKVKKQIKISKGLQTTTQPPKVTTKGIVIPRPTTQQPKVTIKSTVIPKLTTQRPITWVKPIVIPKPTTQRPRVSIRHIVFPNLSTQLPRITIKPKPTTERPRVSIKHIVFPTPITLNPRVTIKPTVIPVPTTQKPRVTMKPIVNLRPTTYQPRLAINPLVKPKTNITINQRQEQKQKDIDVDIHMDIHMKIHFN